MCSCVVEIGLVRYLCWWMSGLSRIVDIDGVVSWSESDCKSVGFVCWETNLFDRWSIVVIWWRR